MRTEESAKHTPSWQQVQNYTGGTLANGAPCPN